MQPHTNIVRLSFEINRDNGELPFRRYFSSLPVAGAAYVIISKLTKENLVDFEVYCMEETGPDRVSQTVTTMEKFFETVQFIEKRLQQDNPSVKLIEMTDESVALETDLKGEVKQNPELARKLAEQFGNKKPDLPPMTTSNRIQKYL